LGSLHIKSAIENEEAALNFVGSKKGKLRSSDMCKEPRREKAGSHLGVRRLKNEDDIR